MKDWSKILSDEIDKRCKSREEYDSCKNELSLLASSRILLEECDPIVKEAIKDVKKVRTEYLARLTA